jgi:hypothetical protein
LINSSRSGDCDYFQKIELNHDKVCHIENCHDRAEQDHGRSHQNACVVTIGAKQREDQHDNVDHNGVAEGHETADKIQNGDKLNQEVAPINHFET